jgi:hypothetical protein
MSRYYFHLRDHDFHTPDHVGGEFSSLELAELAALTVIANLLEENPAWLAELDSPCFDIADDSGEIVSSLPFPRSEKVVH